jgi:signal transduction histidine kinase
VTNTLVSVPQNVVQSAREVFKEAVATGSADPWPRQRPWPLALRWTRWIGIGRLPYNVVTTVVDGIIAWILLATGVGQWASTRPGLGGVWPLVISLTLAVPVLLRGFYPLVAWRMEILTILLAMFLAGERIHVSYPPEGVFAMLFCLYSVGVRCERNITIAVGVVTGIGAFVLGPRESIVACILIAIVLVFGYNVRQRRAVQVQIVEQARAHGQAQAVLQERQRIARELHDVVAHHMSVIAIQAEAAPYKVAEPQPELAESLADIRKLALEGLTELRRVLGVLRTETLDAETAPQPDVDRIGELIESARGAGLTVETLVSGPPRPVPAATGLSAYRITQEALSNVMKHAPGAKVKITMGYGPGWFTLTVRNGPGTVAIEALEETGGGHGLIGMRERAGMLGGEITAEPTSEGGFVVTAKLPTEPVETAS